MKRQPSTTSINSTTTTQSSNETTTTQSSNETTSIVSTASPSTAVSSTTQSSQTTTQQPIPSTGLSGAIVGMICLISITVFIFGGVVIYVKCFKRRQTQPFYNLP